MFFFSNSFCTVPLIMGVSKRKVKLGRLKLIKLELWKLYADQLSEFVIIYWAKLFSHFGCFSFKIYAHRWRHQYVFSVFLFDKADELVLTLFFSRVWRYLWSVTEQTQGNMEYIC